ncbi:hypothetical protein [Desulfonatronum thiosulfatophilum]|nr:hypothetical protein [Desulfonatronum thiosulfatophilum]
MDIESDPRLIRSLGCLAGLMALALLLLWLALRPGGLLSAVFGLVLLLVAVACFTYRHAVHVDVQSDYVEQYRRILFRERYRGFLFSSFTSVGVATVLGGDLRPVYLAHVLELRGRTRLVLPGMHFGLETARHDARKLAQRLGLPLEQRVRTILF